MIDDFQKGMDSYTNASIEEPLEDVVSEFEQNYKTWHTKLSLIKSGIRILTCAVVFVYGFANPAQAMMIMAFGFMLAEFIGVIEEL